MKRKFSLILSVIMLVALLLPNWSFAASADTGLEKILKDVKAKFTIPADLKFDYNVNTSNNHTIWYLNWQSKDGTGPSINVRVDDNGVILGYDYYKPVESSQSKKFPKVTKKDAKAIADAFIKKINPAIAGKVAYQDNAQNSISDDTYYFNYYRVENGIPYYNDYLNVNVNKQTGYVNNYYMNWTDDLVFPSPAGVIGNVKAQQAYKENLGLKIIYKYVYEEDQMKIYAVYTPKYDGSYYAVDAKTGERIKLAFGYYGPYYDRSAMNEKAKLSMAAGGDGVSLNPDEIKAINEVSKLITKEAAEKIARDCKYLGLTSDFKLESSNLYRGWPDRNNFLWNLSFSKPATEQNKESRYASASIDAKTGEINSFYASYPLKEGDTAKYDQKQSKEAVEAFLKEFKPELWSQVEYDENAYDYQIYAKGVKPTSYSFRYVRKVNGAYFPDNNIYVDYDAVNGRVANFNMTWFNTSFPGIDKAVSESTVYGRMFTDVGLELQYKAKYVEPDTEKPVTSDTKPELALVYSLNPSKPVYFDVNTGALVDYDGKPYKENKPVEYTDIKGHYAEKQITALAEYGICLDGKEFKPDQTINQKDYLTLVSRIMSNYYWTIPTQNSTKKEIDDFYNSLVREGVIKQGEKNPSALITKEEGVKFMIRALKYAEVADLKGIFQVSFKDKASINKDLTGYVAIAQGLGIIQGSGGKFLPKAKLTRAQAAVMIYNYLHR